MFVQVDRMYYPVTIPRYLFSLYSQGLYNAGQYKYAITTLLVE